MKRVIACVIALCLACPCTEAAVVEGPVRLGIMKFLTRAEGITEAQAAAIGDIFSRILAGSKTMTVVERDQLENIASEHRMSMSGLLTDETAVQIGKITGCNYMLIGAVTRYEETSSETDLWLISKRKYFASATIDARIVNVETTKVVLSLSESGTTSQKGETVNLPYIGLNTREKMNEKMILKGIEAGAINDAVSRLAFKLRENLTGEYVEVLHPGNSEIVIGFGETAGAQMEGLYRVYAEGREIFGSDGQSLGREMHDLAVVKITKLQPGFSNAALAAKGAGNLALVHKGDKLFPVTQAEMQTMIKNKVFLKSRPRERKPELENLRRNYK